MEPRTDPLASPDFFPVKIDADKNTILFHQMSRDTLRQSAFLDRRAVRAGPTTLLADIRRLPTLPARRPLHFVLHSAFCGSTLLARYLEHLPNCLVIKEPGLLGQLSALKALPPEHDPAAWSEWFDVAMKLLARGYPSDDAVIVKAPDLCNWMARLLLEHDARTRIVFMFCPLRVFLLQVLKVGHRRAWLGEHIKLLQPWFARVPFLSGVDAGALADGQRAAAMWLLNSFLCWQLVSGPGADRVLVLDGEELMARPAEVVQRVAACFALSPDAANPSSLPEFQPITHHAKDSGMPYDAAMRLQELRDAEARCGGEVQAAIAWADGVAGEWMASSPFPIGRAGG